MPGLNQHGKRSYWESSELCVLSHCTDLKLLCYTISIIVLFELYNISFWSWTQCLFSMSMCGVDYLLATQTAYHRIYTITSHYIATETLFVHFELLMP